jgi:hypothetical protein
MESGQEMVAAQRRLGSPDKTAVRPQGNHLLLESQADERIGLDHPKFRRKMLH